MDRVLLPAGGCVAPGGRGVEQVNEQRIADYFSLGVGQIDSLEALKRVRRGRRDHPIPVVILARLVVLRVDQGRGLGVGLLQDAIYRTLVVADRLASVRC